MTKESELIGLNERFVEKIQENTTIISTKQNTELIRTFFEANGLIPGVELGEHKMVLVSDKDERNIVTEKFYNTICVKYPIFEEHIGILLLNLAAKHNGLNNMLIDYLHRLKVSPIVMNYTVTKPVTNAEVSEHFMTVVVPQLEKQKTKKIPIRKKYVRV